MACKLSQSKWGGSDGGRCVEKWVALLSSKPVESTIRIEEGEVIVRPSIVDTDCSVERWL